MNLYLIWQKANLRYDTYDSAVVAAEDKSTAKGIIPSGESVERATGQFGSWTARKNVSVKLIGTAVEGTEQGVICASFNAG